MIIYSVPFITSNTFSDNVTENCLKQKENVHQINLIRNAIVSCVYANMLVYVKVDFVQYILSKSVKQVIKSISLNYVGWSDCIN